MLCAFADCPREGTLVPVIEMQSAKAAPQASCVMNGVVCAECRARVVDAEDLIGAATLLEVEAALLQDPFFGGAADPDLTRIVFVPEAQMLTPMGAPGDA